MRRLNLTYFMELGAQLAPLAQIPPDEANEAVLSRFSLDLNRARAHLLRLVKDETIPLAIPASRPAAQALVDALDTVRTNSRNAMVTRNSMWDVYWKASRLQTLLHGELGVQSVYHIWPKRAFDTNLLIEKATNLFSLEIQAWFNDDETYNVEQAGKCIAFEIPTAAGFHLLRATESVIRRYFAAVVGAQPSLKDRNWGVYIRVLRNHGAEPKVIHALEQIKDLHRNPVIHPEVKLDLEESISLIGITESIISAIYTDMKRREAAAKSSRPVLAAVSGGAAAQLSPADEIPF